MQFPSFFRFIAWRPFWFCLPFPHIIIPIIFIYVAMNSLCYFRHFDILHAHKTNIIYINIRFVSFFRFIAWQTFWFCDLPSYIYYNYICLCCNALSLIFPSLLYTTCPYNKHFQLPPIFRLVAWCLLWIFVNF